MNSRYRSEGCSGPAQKQPTELPIQLEERSRDSFGWTQEQSVTTSASDEQQSIGTYSPGGDRSTPTSLLNPQGLTLTTIVTEVRLKIYYYIFLSPDAPILLRRRTGIDDDKVIEKLTHTFDCNILFTCQKAYQEALSVFYASQTFHCSLTTGGLSMVQLYDANGEWETKLVREGPMPGFSDKLHLMVNMSLGLEIVGSGAPDVVLSRQIAEFARHCPLLRNLSIHLLGSKYQFQDFEPDSHTGSVLRHLRSRLDSLSILVLGSHPLKVLLNLRGSISDDKCWSPKCWTGQSWFDGRWSGECALSFKGPSSQWPYLTIPTLIQGHVDRSCSRSSFYFCDPPLTDDYISKFTCPKDVEEGVGLHFRSLAG